MTAAHHTAAAQRPQPHPLLAAVFAALDERGVRWSVLRGADELSTPGPDVDLLVDPGDVQALRAVTAKLGFARIPAWGYGSHDFHLAYDEPTDSWIKLDVVSELAFGPRFSYATDTAGACLDRRHRAGAAYVLADADAFWCLLLHKLLDKGGLAPADIAELAALSHAPLHASPLARFVDSIAPPAPGAVAFIRAARARRWDTISAAIPALAAGWSTHRRLDVWRRRMRGSAARQCGRLLRRHRRRGLTVALLGPDGAGKSTVASALQDTFYFPTYTLYMGPGQPHRGRRRPPGIGLALRLAGAVGRWLDAVRHQSRGQLVVFDRYVFDALLPPRRPLDRLGKGRRWLLGNALPPPSLTIVLDAPGRLLHARKGEQTPATLETERHAYRALARRLANSAVIDASQPPDDVRRAITSAIWHAWRRRWNG